VLKGLIGTQLQTACEEAVHHLQALQKEQDAAEKAHDQGNDVQQWNHGFR
jgi:NAD dependent epimerase/dehydratase family enzyme